MPARLDSLGAFYCGATFCSVAILVLRNRHLRLDGYSRLLTDFIYVLKSVFLNRFLDTFLQELRALLYILL